MKLEIAPQQIEADWGLSPFALGIQPFLMAFVLVELVALAVPRWRPLRISGPAGRAHLLSAVWKLAFLLCFLQAFARVLYLQRAGFVDSSALTRLWGTLSTVASTSFLVLLAQLVQRNGVGGGFSVLCAAMLTPDLVHLATTLDRLASTWPKETRLVMAALVAVVFTSVCILRWRPRDVHGVPWPIRIPACGLVPLTLAAAILSFIVTLESYLRSEPPRPFSGVMTSANVALVALLCLGFGLLFNRPFRVAATSSQLGRASSSTAAVRALVGRAVGYSAAYVIAVRLTELWMAKTLPDTTDSTPISVLSLVVLSAVALDVIDEVRAIQQHGVHVAVWPEHRVYAVDQAIALLERTGIPAFPRSLHHRTLWHFYAPFIPIEIMVPTSRAGEAAALLRETLLEVERRGPESEGSSAPQAL